jgi:hypothetical protein
MSTLRNFLALLLVCLISPISVTIADASNFDVLKGIRDVSTVSGSIFRLQVPQDAFSGPARRYVVRTCVSITRLSHSFAVSHIKDAKHHFSLSHFHKHELQNKMRQLGLSMQQKYLSVDL